MAHADCPSWAGVKCAAGSALIFGLGIFPALGLNGVAVATVIGQVCATGLTFWVLGRKSQLWGQIRRNFKPSLRIVTAICRVGLPAFIMEIAALLVMVVMNRELVLYGSGALAVLGVFLRIRSFIYMPVFGLCQGAMPVAAFAYGGGKNDRVKETLVKASVLAFFLIGAAWFVIQYCRAGLYKSFLVIRPLPRWVSTACVLLPWCYL